MAEICEHPVSVNFVIQGISELLAWIFLNVATYKAGVWDKSMLTSIFPMFWAVLTLAGGLIGRRTSETVLKQFGGVIGRRSPHVSVIVWTAVVFIIHCLCQIGLAWGTHFKWEFAAILTVVFDAVYFVSCIHFVYLTIQNYLCSSVDDKDQTLGQIEQMADLNQKENSQNTDEPVLI